MVVKVDLEKAYDRINWSFIEDNLTDIDLPKDMVKIIMKCVTSPIMKLAQNGYLSTLFHLHVV